MVSTYSLQLELEKYKMGQTNKNVFGRKWNLKDHLRVHKKITIPQDWYWTESQYNIVDWLTRGKQPNEINLHSSWQDDPDFLKLPEDEGPITQKFSEPLPKRIKRIAFATTILSELQTLRISNLVNQRPTGRHPTSPDDGMYLCSNDLLLGRSKSRVPNGLFAESSNLCRRFTLVQNITTNFWKRWTRKYFPNLIIRQKCHTDHRNVAVGDVVLIQDLNLVRGQWRFGKVSKVFQGTYGTVRKVEVQYKNPKPG